MKRSKIVENVLETIDKWFEERGDMERWEWEDLKKAIKHAEKTRGEKWKKNYIKHTI